MSRVISEFVAEMVTEAVITDRGLSSGGDIGLMTTEFSHRFYVDHCLAGAILV